MTAKTANRAPLAPQEWYAARRQELLEADRNLEPPALFLLLEKAQRSFAAVRSAAATLRTTEPGRDDFTTEGLMAVQLEATALDLENLIWDLRNVFGSGPAARGVA